MFEPSFPPKRNEEHFASKVQQIAFYSFNNAIWKFSKYLYLMLGPSYSTPSLKTVKDILYPKFNKQYFPLCTYRI